MSLAPMSKVDIEPTPGRVIALKPKVALTCGLRVPANSWMNLSAVWVQDVSGFDILYILLDAMELGGLLVQHIIFNFVLSGLNFQC